jgi:hypothetical protein
MAAYAANFYYIPFASGYLLKSFKEILEIDGKINIHI